MTNQPRYAVGPGWWTALNSPPSAFYPAGEAFDLCFDRCLRNNVGPVGAGGLIHAIAASDLGGAGLHYVRVKVVTDGGAGGVTVALNIIRDAGGAVEAADIGQISDLAADTMSCTFMARSATSLSITTISGFAVGNVRTIVQLKRLGR